jgi:hypothetical protein
MVVLNLEAVEAGIGPGEMVEARVFQVEDVAAVEADEVMVLVELGVEAGGRAGVAGLGEQAERDEGPQNTVDGHAGDLGEIGAHGAVHLLGGGVVGAAKGGFEDSAALGGERQAAFAMGGEEVVDAQLFFRRAHVTEINICTR